MNKILIIEDDVTINGLLRSIIEKNGYIVDNVYNGIDGLAMGLHEDYSLILLDLMLPEKTGEDIVKELRRVKETPIIVLSAKSKIYNRVELLQLGVDDYITKPFDIDEVLLRIQAVLRRTSGQETEDITFHELVIKTDSNISVQGATNDIKKCFRYAEWKSQIFHSIFTYSLVALIDEIRPSVAFLLSSKLIFSQSSR